MKKNIGILLSTALLAFSSISFAEEAQTSLTVDVDNTFYSTKLSNMDEVKSVLATGGVVTASMDLTKCTLSTGQPSRNLAGGLKINSYLIERDGTLRFSSYRTTLSSRSDVAVSQNNKYRVTDDGAVTFTSSVFSMPDYELISKVDVYCQLNESFYFYNAY
jgi:hypothetical protein